MSATPGDERRALAAEEAAAWMLRLESDQPGAAERGQFVDWLRESPLHVAEMLRIGAVHGLLTDFQGWKELTAADPAPSSTVVSLPMRETGARGAISPARHPQRKYLGLLAAAVAFMAITVVLLLDRSSDHIRTLGSEHREIKLADGSLMEVAPDSELHLRLGRKERLVVLDHGEALFHVAKDAARPFVVRAGQTDVRAVGTAFSVGRNAAAVVVTVAEGKVTVSNNSVPRTPAGASTTSISLGADEQVAIAVDGTPAAVHPVRSQTELGWARGLLIFSDDTVADIVQRFNASNRLQIRLLDQALAARQVSGVFDTSDPQSFVAFLENAADVTVVRGGAEEILISAPSSGKSPKRSPAPTRR